MVQEQFYPPTGVTLLQTCISVHKFMIFSTKCIWNDIFTTENELDGLSLRLLKDHDIFDCSQGNLDLPEN